uniref:P-type phospholipid transporter n=1 Tax=Timema genevievae TaxID=629358 RepID=A0A7R9JNP3_TIMGE|nr:unnamed protein product [Timema genevievae]
MWPTRAPCLPVDKFVYFAMMCVIPGNRVSVVGDTRTLDVGVEDPSASKFTKNRIVTCKYTVWNFLPKNLFEQFRRIANFYFLCMTTISLSIDSPVSPWTSVVPLVFVILVTAMKQGYEDWLRHRADREVNCSLVTVVRHGIAQEVESQEVCVGDLVRVACDADVPCDIILLASSEQDGKCYVTTANLDGETNLKTLLCPRILKSYSLPEQLTSLRAQVECEQPTPDLYKFFGKLEILVEPPDKGRESWGGTLRRHWNSFRSSVSTSTRRKTTPATFIGVNGVVAAYDNDLTGAPKGAANEDRSHISVNVNDAFVPQPNGTGRDQDDPGPMKALPF